MTKGGTTALVQQYLDEWDADASTEAVIRSLLGRATFRLRSLCGALLNRSYPRLARPPLNLDADEMIGAVVERLIKALRNARPTTVRQFFALASQHIRWELNDLARLLDDQPRAEQIEGELPAPGDDNSSLSPAGLRIVRTIDELPADERDAFDLVRVQGMPMTEAALVLGVSATTVKRRLDRALRLLADLLADLEPTGSSGSAQDGSE
jgi:RNA polymerase sigma factor (sigma-70 family)